MKKINLQLARQLAKQIVAEAGPGFTYQLNPGSGCYYVPLPQVREWGDRVVIEPSETDPREKTGCLAGRVIDAVGETRHHHKKHSADNVMDLRAAYPELMTHRAAKYLYTLQRMQDDGKSWEESLATGEDGANSGRYTLYSDDEN